MILLITTPLFTLPFEITNDDISTGIVFQNFSSAHIFGTNKHLYFKYNVTSVRKLFSWSKIMLKNCLTNSSKIHNLEFEIEENIQWNLYKPEPKTESENALKIYNELYFDTILSNFMNEFDENIDNCKTLDSLTYNFSQMNRELNNLAKLNISAVGEIIMLEKMVDIIHSMLGNKYTLSYDLNYANVEKFLEILEFNFYYANYTITLAFDVPVYSKTLIYQIYPKPILIKNTPYILQTNEKYAAIIDNIPIFYNKNNFLELCFFKTNSFFCIKPHENWKCERNLVLKNKPRKNCLQRLPKNNIITRIRETIYLTVFRPIIFQVNCTKSTYFIKIIDHSTLTNEQNCQLKSSIYEYNSEKINTQYDLQISNEPDINDFLFTNQDNLILFDLYLTLAYLIFIILLHLLTLIIIMARLKGKLKEINDLKIKNASHEYESINYLTL